MGKIAGDAGIGRSNDAAEIKGDELGGVVRGWKIGDFGADEGWPGAIIEMRL